MFRKLSILRFMTASMMSFLLNLHDSIAAPFCLELDGVAPQCDYVDVAACRRRAAKISGSCIANPEEISLPKDIGDYCVIDATLSYECMYPDRASCEDEAKRRNAVCMDNSVQEDAKQKKNHEETIGIYH